MIPQIYIYWWFWGRDKHFFCNFYPSEAFLSWQTSAASLNSTWDEFWIVFPFRMTQLTVAKWSKFVVSCSTQWNTFSSFVKNHWHQNKAFALPSGCQINVRRNASKHHSALNRVSHGSACLLACLLLRYGEIWISILKEFERNLQLIEFEWSNWQMRKALMIRQDAFLKSQSIKQRFIQ